MLINKLFYYFTTYYCNFLDEHQIPCIFTDGGKSSNLTEAPVELRNRDSLYTSCMNMSCQQNMFYE